MICAQGSSLFALHRGGTGIVYPEGGYKAVTPIQMANVLGAADAGLISLRGVRVYFGCFELQARREAAGRVRGDAGRRRATGVRYSADELARLLGDVSPAAARTEFRRLERAGLLCFVPESIAVTETPLGYARDLLADLCGGRKAARPIPVPRRLLAFLCRCHKPALLKTLLAYLVRGLSIERGTGEVRGAGAVKATWIARVLGLSERSVRSARAELIQLGVITKDVGSHQRKLNRDGAYFRVNLAWKDAAHPRIEAEGAAEDVRASAPPVATTAGRFAPPEKRPKTPSDLKDQKLAPCEPAGACGRRGEVRLRDVRPADIRRLSSLRELYDQAVCAGWLRGSEASFLAFAAAAVRANRVGTDPVRLFVAIVRRGLWHHVTAADEDRARAVIGRDRERESLGAVNSVIQGLLRRAA
jgi:hypothetical protein